MISRKEPTGFVMISLHMFVYTKKSRKKPHRYFFSTSSHSTLQFHRKNLFFSFKLVISRKKPTGCNDFITYICLCLLDKHFFAFFWLGCLNFQRSKSNVITSGRLQVYVQNTPFGRGGACIGLKPSGFTLRFLANTCSPLTSRCILQYTFSHLHA